MKPLNKSKLMIIALGMLAGLAFISLWLAGSETGALAGGIITGTPSFLPLVFKPLPTPTATATPTSTPVPPVPQFVQNIPLPGAQCPNSVFVNEVTDYVYIANNFSHDISFLRGTDYLGNVPSGGKWPTRMTMIPESGRTFITNLHRLQPGDPASPMAEFDGMSLLGTYSQKFEAFTPLYNTVNQHLYITDLDSNIRVYDASTLPLTFVKDIGVADGVRGWIKTITYDPTTGLVYAASWDYGELYVIDGTTVTAVISTQTWGPEELLFDPIHNYIYIVGQEVDNRPVGYPAHNITVFDAAPPHQFRAGFATSTSSHRLGQDPLSGLVYAANRVADSVTIVNGLQMLGTVPVGAAPNDVAANPNTGYVFVANSNSNDITVLKNGAVVSTIASQGIRPYAIGIDSRNNYVYVANRGTEGHLSCTTNASVTIVR